MGMPCVNCQQIASQTDAKFFHGVFVCGTCYAMAERLYTRAHKELNSLLMMLQESIRIAIIEHRLQFKEGQGEELPKRDVLEAIVMLQEMKDAHKARSMAASGGSISLAGSGTPPTGDSD